MPEPKNNSDALVIACHRRKNPTAAQNALWQLLRCKTLGMRVRRQHVIGHHILDFYIHAAHLCIEVDGPRKRPDYRVRAAHLRAKGIATLRLRDEDILRDPSRCRNDIANAVRNSRLRRTASTPCMLSR
jgi:leucyl-tRNA synthetase